MTAAASSKRQILSPGLLLAVAAVVGIALINSPLASSFTWLCEYPLTIGLSPFSLQKSVVHWINDGLMVLFFLLVGLEIKKELLVGELSSWNQAILPVMGALGGMVVPACIYGAFNWGDPAALRGWAIPSATDIAFALGAVSLMGTLVSHGARVFLTALAIIDDLGAILIIAFFYATTLHVTPLLIAGGISLALFSIGKTRYRGLLLYLLLGLALWLCVLKSGIHPTIAGVVLAFALPYSPDPRASFHKLEHALKAPVEFVILPLFALVNSGFALSTLSLSALSLPVPLGIIAGLFLGKQLGILGGASLPIIAGWSSLPLNTSWRQLYGVCALAGIGFTMSLFIGELAFPGAEFADLTRAGVLVGSLLSGVWGAVVILGTRGHSKA